MKGALDSLLRGRPTLGRSYAPHCLAPFFPKLHVSHANRCNSQGRGQNARSFVVERPGKLWERAAGPLIAAAVAYGSLENALLCFSVRVLMRLIQTDWRFSSLLVRAKPIRFRHWI